MSATAIENLVQEQPNDKRSAPRKLGLAAAAFLSLALLFAPRWVAGLWRRVAIWRAAVIAAIHLSLGVVWLSVLATVQQLWSGRKIPFIRTDGWSARVSEIVSREFAQAWLDMRGLLGEGTYDHVLRTTAYLLLTGMMLTVAFFVMLPFAVRPGKNGPCVRHVIRAALLATGLIHIFMAVLCGTFAGLIWFDVTEEWMVPVVGGACVLALLSLWALIRAVRVDYRTPADMPVAPEPRCDECGYDLHIADAAGRCPECGKPVEASLSAETRRETAWEKNPSLRNTAAIKAQTRDIIRRPQALFSSMSTLSGHRAAQRWVLIWMTVVGFVAFWIAPLLTIQLKYVHASRVGPHLAPWFLRDIDQSIQWSWALVEKMAVGGVALGIFWAVAGMMMVGIETAGVVGVAHFRGQKVPLSATVKVTCYASPLMLVWVVLGAAQILGLLWAYQRGWMMQTLRVEQIVLVMSTAIAHIGGLLWFEWTVYRGLRGIRFANH